jgi:hypothetical protein
MNCFGKKIHEKINLCGWSSMEASDIATSSALRAILRLS